MKKVKIRKIQKPPKRGKIRIALIRKAVKALSKKRDIVQVKNPKSGLYVKIDRAAGVILSHKKTEGKYKGVKIARKKKNGVSILDYIHDE